MLNRSLIAALAAFPSAAHGEEPARYTKTPTGYMMVLRQGDDVLQSLERLVEAERIPSASITGIGFLKDVTFGFYDFAKKDFQPKEFHDVEMAGMTGSLAWKEGKPSVHAHAMVAGPDFKAVGGHLLAAKVGTGSAEITVVTHDRRLERKVDPDLGVNVLQLE